MRCTCFLVTLLAPICSVIATPHSESSAPSKPNIVFIFADDVGWGDLGCYGNTRTRTPELDNLAANGTLFTQFYVAGPVCSPSRVGIMTGQFPSRNSVFGHFARPHVNQRRNMPEELDPGIYTLTDHLRSGGYVTGHFGKWHLGMRDPSPHSVYGIDYYRTNKHSNMAGGELIDISTPDARPVSSKRIVDATLDFIREQKDQPFYANLWLFDMHTILNPSDEQLHPFKHLKPRHNQGEIPFHGIEEVYFAALAEMDRQIGRFMDELESMGLLENTLVIFSSDNGPEDYQITGAAHSGAGNSGPFRGRKRSLYEGGIRVPFILHWPGHVPAGAVNNTTVVNGVDFLPTIASLADIPLPGRLELDGEDVHTAWLGEAIERQSPLFWDYRYGIFGHPLNKSPFIAVREGPFKLLLNPDQSRVELYHIPDDPSELNNLSSEHPELTTRLTQMALDWYASLPDSPPDAHAGANEWPWPENKRTVDPE